MELNIIEGIRFREHMTVVSRGFQNLDYSASLHPFCSFTTLMPFELQGYAAQSFGGMRHLSSTEHHGCVGCWERVVLLHREGCIPSQALRFGFCTSQTRLPSLRSNDVSVKDVKLTCLCRHRSLYMPSTYSKCLREMYYRKAIRGASHNALHCSSFLKPICGEQYVM